MQRTTFFQMNLPGVNDPAYIEAINANTRKIDSLLSEVPQSFSVATKGYFSTIEELQAAHPTGSDGDAYIVGTGEDATVYAWTPSGWANVGKVQGPAGASGVLTVNGKAPDSAGNVNVQAGVTSVFGREGAVTAQAGDYDITQITGAKRENLLINAWFLNPVNQRGETSYLRNGYTIDMWKTQNASTEVSLTANGIKVVQTYTSQPIITQLTETVFPAGTTMTVSAIMKGDGINAPKIQVSKVFSSDTNFVGEANNDEWQMVTATFVTELEGAPSVALYCSTNNTNPPVFEIAAAKLEMGEGQTLAHQDADGNWVLNEIPDYAEELAKCQRYFYAVRTTGNNMLATAIANTTTNLLFAMPLPVPMRANPAASYSNLLYSKAGGSAGSAPSSVSPISTINNETAIRTLMLGGSFTTGTPYALILKGGGYLYLDANL